MNKLFENFRRYIKEDEKKPIATLVITVMSGEVREVKFANHPIKVVGEKGEFEVRTDKKGDAVIGIPYPGKYIFQASHKDHTVRPEKLKYFGAVRGDFTPEIFQGGEDRSFGLTLLDLDRDAPNSTKNLYKPGDIIGITPPKRKR